MADVISGEGLENLLNVLVNSPDPIKYRLYRNDFTPGAETVLAGYTEANYSGYAPADVRPLSAPESLDNGSVRTQSIPVTLAHNGGPVSNDVFGYFLTLETTGGPRLLWGGRFEDAPFSMVGVSDIIEEVITLNQRQEV